MRKVKSTKRGLLISLLLLVLCLSMFVGTTFAWFTDSLTSSSNIIKSGTLDVTMKWADGKENPNNDTTKWEDAEKIAIFNYDLWEPGYTEVRHIKIANEGTLALKYKVLVVANGEVTDLADVIDVYYADPAKQVSTRKDLANVPKLGVLSDVLNNVETTATGELLAGETHTLTIVLKMQETAGNEYQNKSIGTDFSVVLLATQASYESDSFGNDYDKNAEYEAADIHVSTPKQLQEAITNAADGDVINIEAGVYDLTEITLNIEKAVVLQGTDASNKPVIKVLTEDASYGSSNIKHGIEINSSNVTLKNLIIEADPSGVNSGNLVQISPNGTEFFSDIVISGCEFYGSDHCIALYGNNVTIENCILDESNAKDQGNIIYVWGTSGRLTIRNNTFIGRDKNKHGISFYYQSAASKMAGDIVIEGNTFTDVYKGVVHESSMTYDNVSVMILNNSFNCKKKPIAIDKGSFLSYTVNENVFVTSDWLDKCIIDNKVNTAVNADRNYWNSSKPIFPLVISGSNVTINNYYIDSVKTNLVNK